MDIKTQDVWVVVDVNVRLPKKESDFYMCIVSGKGLCNLYFIHKKWATLSQVTHWLEPKSDVIILTEAEYLADKKKTAEAAIKHFRRMRNHLPNTL